MFERWLDEYATWKVNQSWKNFVRNRRTPTLDDIVPWVRAEGGPFLQHTWITLGNIGHSAMLQKHYFTFLMLYKGCTKSGLILTAAVGLTSPWTQFNEWRKQQIDLAKEAGM